MRKHRIKHLETHLAHGCNLACESCTHFSQDGHSGRTTPERFKAELAPWAARLEPNDFLLLGGEPLLNPQLLEILPIARGLWPSTRIGLVTNGLLLNRFPDLPRVLLANGIRLDISIHHDAPEYLAKMAEVKALTDSWGIAVRYRQSHRDWTRAYRGTGADVMPYTDHQPELSWAACVSKWCMNVLDGQLYKCPVLAYLPMQARKFALSPVWDKYLEYKPLDASCSDAELIEFIGRRCESMCSMCPARPEHFLKQNPMVRV